MSLRLYVKPTLFKDPLCVVHTLGHILFNPVEIIEFMLRFFGPPQCLQASSRHCKESDLG